MIELLCDDSTSCKEAGDNNDYHRPGQRQTFNMSVKSMRISLDHWTSVLAPKTYKYTLNVLILET